MMHHYGNSARKKQTKKVVDVDEAHNDLACVKRNSWNACVRSNFFAKKNHQAHLPALPVRPGELGWGPVPRKIMHGKVGHRWTQCFTNNVLHAPCAQIFRSSPIFWYKRLHLVSNFFARTCLYFSPEFFLAPQFYLFAIRFLFGLRLGSVGYFLLLGVIIFALGSPCVGAIIEGKGGTCQRDTQGKLSNEEFSVCWQRVC